MMKPRCPTVIVIGILLQVGAPGKSQSLRSTTHGACSCAVAIAIRRFLPLSAHDASRRAVLQGAITLQTHCSFPKTSANRDLVLDKRCLYCYNDNR